MSSKKRIATLLAVAAGYLILPLLLYGNVTIGRQTMIPADNLFQWQPWATYAADFGITTPENSLLSDLLIENTVWKQYIRETVQSGDIPLWNPYLFAGAPFLATGQNAAYYPFGLLFLLLPLSAAYGWYTLSQIWLAGWLMYGLMRVLRVRPAGAFVAGLVFQGCGFMLVSAAVFPMIIGAAAWLPLCLAALEMVIGTTTNRKGDGQTLPWAALGALALGVQILAGHIEFTYYSLIVMAFFAVWRLASRWLSGRWDLGEGSERWRRLLRPPVWLLVTVAAGLMLGGLQFIPFYEVGTSNFREGSATLDEVRGWAFPTRRLITFAVPDFFGNPADHSYVDAFSLERKLFSVNAHGRPNPHGAGTSSWGIKNYVEGGIYLGILPLFLALLGIWYGLRPRRNREKAGGQGIGRRRSAVGFFAALSFFSLSFIFGTPLYAVLYYGFPGINQLHSPFRWVFPLSVSVAALAGYGMDYLARSRERRLKTVQRGAAIPLDSRLVRWTGWLALAGGGLVLAGLAAVWAAFGTFEPLVEQVFRGLAQAPDAFPDGRAFFSYQAANGLILGGMLLAAGLVLLISQTRLNLRGLPLYRPLAMGVILVDLLLIGYGFNASVDPALLDFKPEMIRWLEAQPDRHLWRLTTFDNKGSKPFNANTPWLTGFQDIRGYDSIIARQYVRYMEAIEPQNELAFNRIQPVAELSALDSPLLDLLGVKFIITEERLDLPKLRLAWEGEGVRVYENLAVMPRIYLQAVSATVPVNEDTVFDRMQDFDPRFFALIDPAAAGDPLGDDLAAAAAKSFFCPAEPRPAAISQATNRQIVIEAAPEEASWLILNDSYFPGWRAFVRPAGAPETDEIERPVRLVNGNFRAVFLEPGLWTVRFQYTPFSFWLGLLTTALGTVTIVFAFAVWGWRRYRPRGELTNTRSIAKNSVLPMGLNLFNRGIDFLFAAYYLRLLGPADSGAFATAIAIAGMYEILANFGLNAYLIREVSQDRARTSGYLLNTTVLRLFTGLFAALPILLYVWGSTVAPDTLAAVIYLMVGMVFSGMASGLTGLFYAYEEAEIPAAVTTITTIMKVVFGVIVLLLGYGFVGLAGNSILVNLITLGLLLYLVRARYPLRGPWRVDFRLQWQMVRHSYPLMINHLLATIYWQVDVLILSQMKGDAVVGWYNSAYKYINAFNIIPSFFTFALFPVISRQVASSIEDARRTFRMSAKLLMLAALPLAAVVTLLAPLMIRLLGGEAFLPDGHIALRVVIWSIPFGWLNSVTNYVLISLGQERVQTRAFLTGVGFNIVSNILIIPYLSYVGAGLTTILSEIILLALFNYYLVQKMPGVRWGALLWRPVAVTGLMLAVMLGAAMWNQWVGLGLGLLVYPAGLWALRVFGEEERRILASVLPGRLAARLPLV